MENCSQKKKKVYLHEALEGKLADHRNQYETSLMRRQATHQRKENLGKENFQKALNVTY